MATLVSTETKQRVEGTNDITRSEPLQDAGSDNGVQCHDLPQPESLEQIIVPSQPDILGNETHPNGNTDGPLSLKDMDAKIRRLKLEIEDLRSHDDLADHVRLNEAIQEKKQTEEAIIHVLRKYEDAQQRIEAIEDQKANLGLLRKELEKAHKAGKSRKAMHLEYLKIPALEAVIAKLEDENIRSTADNVDVLEDESAHLTEDNVDASSTATGKPQIMFETAGERLERLAVLRRVRLESDSHEELEHLKVLTAQFEALDWLVTKLGDKPVSEPQPEDKEPHARVPAVPEIKRMTWAEWLEGDRDIPPTKHFAIDLLCEEPPPLDWRGVRLVETNQTLPAGSTQRPGPRPLPDSMRINSMAVKTILDSLCDGRLYWDGPLLIPKPYKVLIYAAQSIPEKLLEIQQEIARRPNPDEVVLADNDPSKSTSRQPFEEGFNLADLTTPEVKEAYADFRCLNLFLEEYIIPLRKHLQGNPDQVCLDELWHLFTPGSMVYVKDKSVPQKVWKVMQATGGRKYRSKPDDERLASTWTTKSSRVILDCYHHDHNGTRYVRTFSQFYIDGFSDYQPITSLAVLPLAVAEAEKLVETSTLTDQGNQFVECIKVRHLWYEGRSLSRDPGGKQLYRPKSDSVETSPVYSEPIDSEVMIDFERTLQAIPDWTPVNDEISIAVADPAELNGQYDHDNKWDDKINDQFLDAVLPVWKEWDKNGRGPAGNDLLLLPDRVFGFVFRTRTWACLQLGKNADDKPRLRAVPEKKDAWKDLEIPGQHKMIVQSLIDSHFEKGRSKDNGFDLVAGKGKGVVLLLHGAPGVGKTSTAECVAKSNNRPLLPITCADLGMTASEVERNLQTDFQLAQAWNCILLLDEADIFLAERTSRDVKRNSLVSVFLRVLEYYEGILFLTTNRVGDFDEAFISRIHMALYYPALDWQQTANIWKSHIRRARENSEENAVRVQCEEPQLLNYAEMLFGTQMGRSRGKGTVWNGRQIRNAFQSAVALARHESKKQSTSGDLLSVTVTVTEKHFKIVADVSDDFNDYLLRVNHGRSAGDISREQELRDDSFGINPMSRASYQFAKNIPEPVTPVMRHANNSFAPLYQTPDHQRQVYGTNLFTPGSQSQNQPAFASQSVSPYSFQGQQVQQPGQFYGGQPNQLPHGISMRDNSQQFMSAQQPGAHQYVQNQQPGTQQYAQAQQPASFTTQGNTGLAEQAIQNQGYAGQPGQIQGPANGYPQQQYQGQQPSIPGAGFTQGFPGQPEAQALQGAHTAQG